MSEVEPLTGEYDVTIPLHDVTKYATGEQPADWLMVQGRPRQLRPNGWVYVRTDSKLVGRARAIGTGVLEVRSERTGSPPGVRGPGPVVFLDPDTWDLSRTWDLSGDRRFYGQGTRYVLTDDDGSLRHWSATEGEHYGDPVPLVESMPPDVGDVVQRAREWNRHESTGDEAGADGWMVEGAMQLTQVVSYERNRKARARSIRVHGTDCLACGMNFGERYGELGDGFIHVHHLREISTVGSEYVIDPVDDLRPLCPNCHAMVHRQKPALSVEELRQIIAQSGASARQVAEKR